MGNTMCCESKEVKAGESVQALLQDMNIKTTPRDCQKACLDSGACFAIYWGFDEEKGVLRPMAHWNPPERVRAMKEKTGSDELYTTESYKVQMKPGDGFVGKAYSDSEAMFFPDVSQLPLGEYKRKDLAAKFGVVSLALKPFADGIMEIGATSKWVACSWIHTVTEKDCEIAAKDAGASFAIFWGFDMDKGVLRPMAHWNPLDRIAEVRAKTGSEDLYTTCSYRVEMTPGSGNVGKVFRDRSSMFYPNVSKLSLTEYKRKDLAARFGVKSLAMKTFADGVMEIGSAQPWDTCEWVDTMSSSDCKWAAKEAGADFAIYWGFDKSQGVLRPMKHWNPPERIAAVRAATGKTDLYTTESYAISMKSGDGFVGKCYQDKRAMFFPDVSQLQKSEYKRKDLAANFGIVSLALKPVADGVMEIGTSRKWDACGWVSAVTPKDCERAAKEAGASFSIFWGFDAGRSVLRPMAHWNPPQRVADVIAKTGSDDLYTTESYRFMMQPGVGFVGKAFQNKETMFFPDVTTLPLSDFKRKGLAARFGLASLAFKPFANGIMEVGAATNSEICDWANKVTVEDCENVCLQAGGSFCIFWNFDATKGALRPTCHWNPPERVAVMKAMTGKDELYTTDSYKLEFSPGVGFVGNAYQNKETMFFPDVTQLSSAEYKRKDLANRFGIVSLAFKPFGNGVYEVGSTKKWDTCDWVNAMSVEDCRKACLDMKGSFAIFWGIDKISGMLHPICHWNPPERVAAVKAATGSDELYTIESYRVQIKPGDGFVGKVYQGKKAMSFEDVSKLSETDFKRKSLAQKYGIVSMALWPFAGGVMEVGSAQSQQLNISNWMGA